MNTTWLHVSDFHFRAGDPYDRDVVLRALIRSVQRFRERGRAPDLIFATGDIGHSGKDGEYELATRFFDDLIAAAGLDRHRLFLVPGNHDVDQTRGVGLARTLGSREEADAYFSPDVALHHLSSKQAAFLRWYKRYFEGIRSLPEDSSCGPVEAIEVRGGKIGILPINSALFCQDDNDHAKLWVGRRCLDVAIEGLVKLGAALHVVLLHHPLDWLHDIERSNIKAKLQANVDFMLRGHLHESGVEDIGTPQGQALHLAAGACYQTRRWPNRALYCTIDGPKVSVFPIRYEDQPEEVWTVDPSLFPQELGYEKSFPIPRLAGPAGQPAEAGTATSCEPTPTPRFRSNIPSRWNLPFVGRDDLAVPLFRRPAFVHFLNDQMHRNYGRRGAPVVPASIQGIREAILALYLFTPETLFFPTIDLVESPAMIRSVRWLLPLARHGGIAFVGGNIDAASFVERKRRHFARHQLYAGYYDGDPKLLRRAEPFWQQRALSTTADVARRFDDVVTSVQGGRLMAQAPLGTAALAAGLEVMSAERGTARASRDLANLNDRLRGQAMLWDIILRDGLVSPMDFGVVDGYMRRALAGPWVASHLDELAAFLPVRIPVVGVLDVGASEARPQDVLFVDVLIALLRRHGLLALLIHLTPEEVAILRHDVSVALLREHLWWPAIIHAQTHGGPLTGPVRQAVRMADALVDRQALPRRPSTAFQTAYNLVNRMADSVGDAYAAWTAYRTT